MNKIYFWVVGILIALLLIVAGLLILKLNSTTSATATSTTTRATFPVSNSSNTSTDTALQPGIQITVQGGGKVTTSNFENNGQTVKDVENPGTYLLAGSLGYCLPNIKCTAGTATDYNIKYDSTTQSFGIALLKEPIGQARTEAEQYLMNILGLTKDQMCSLNYYVGTTYDVNETYDTGNLGFSFCPGAVQLP